MAAFLLLTLHPPASLQAAEDAGDRPPATVGLVGGQVLVGHFEEEYLTVRTRYGTLSVPFREIIRVRLSPRIPEAQGADFRRALEELASEGLDSAAGKRALTKARNLGLGVVPELRALSTRLEDGTLKDAVDGIVAGYTKDEDAYVEPLDEVATERFTMKGEVVEELLHVRCVSGTLPVPRSDVRHITFRDVEIHEVWKIGPQYSEQETFLDTKFKVRKGQKFTLKPSGTMSYNGQSFGPGGLPNHTWNGRRMGCLQWRIGEGAWTVLESDFEGRAPQTGPIHFCVHVFSGRASGEFKVELRSRKK